MTQRHRLRKGKAKAHRCASPPLSPRALETTGFPCEIAAELSQLKRRHCPRFWCLCCLSSELYNFGFIFDGEVLLYI